MKATKSDEITIKRADGIHSLLPAYEITTWSMQHGLSGSKFVGIVINLDDGDGKECLRVVELTPEQARNFAQDIIDMANKLDAPSQA